MPAASLASVILVPAATGEGQCGVFLVEPGSDGVELEEQIRYPDSIGMLYSAFTYYTGFKVNSGEYKLMGLAPYGEPVYVDKIMSICKLLDNSFFVR